MGGRREGSPVGCPRPGAAGGKILSARPKKKSEYHTFSLVLYPASVPGRQQIVAEKERQPWQQPRQFHLKVAT